MTLFDLKLLERIYFRNQDYALEGNFKNKQGLQKLQCFFNVVNAN